MNKRLCSSHKSSTGIVRHLFYQNINFLDIERCPVKFRYKLNLYGAHTAFFRVIEGEVTSAGHCTVAKLHPANRYTYWTGTRQFCLKFQS